MPEPQKLPRPPEPPSLPTPSTSPSTRPPSRPRPRPASPSTSAPRPPGGVGDPSIAPTRQAPSPRAGDAKSTDPTTELDIAAPGSTVHGPPYRAGPSGGDSHTVTKTNRKTGTILVLEHNSRQAAFVHCVGLGPMGNLEVHHEVTEPVRSVTVHYVEAVLTDSVVVNAIVRGSASGWLGHAAALGPTTFLADHNGVLNIPLHSEPKRGETLRIQFGLQTHAGCLPYPVLGLPGSRVVEKGSARFVGVAVG
jgi:hypothetical protein